VQSVTTSVQENPGMLARLGSSASAAWASFDAWAAGTALGEATSIGGIAIGAGASALVLTTASIGAALFAVGLVFDQASKLYMEWPSVAPHYDWVKDQNGEFQRIQISSIDPNYLSGAEGYGSQGFVQPQAELPYQIDFENEAKALAPAQTVTITQQIDQNLDWSTFQLGSFGFGGQTYSIPAGRQYYTTRIDATSTDGVYVDVTANFDQQTGKLTWTFTSIDPKTMDQPKGNLLEGFLPPDKTAPQGQGWVSYFVQPKATDPTGTVIQAQASVVFDSNAPIDTQQFVNTIDAGAPTSSVAPLPADSLPTFTVSWSGSDDPGGSGVQSYDVYVSDNGGPFTLWQNATTVTSAEYDGVVGHTYAFYSVATDNVGNVESTSDVAQASTVVDLLSDTMTSVVSSTPVSTYGGPLTFTASVSTVSPGLPRPSGTVQFLIDGVSFGVPVNLVDGSATSATVTSLSAGNHTVSAIYSGDTSYPASAAENVTQTVNPATLDVTADNQHMNHGDPVPVLSYSISGFVNGDSASVVNGTASLGTTGTSSSGAGYYEIQVGTGTLSAANYTFNPVDGTLTVQPKVVDVRLDYGTQSISLLGLTRDLPFATINAIDIIFSDNVAVSMGQLSLKGVNIPNYGIQGFNYNPNTDDATWTLPSALGIDRLMMALDGVTFGSDPSISVNHLGTNFAVLPGDFNGDGVVDGQDMVGIRNEIQGTGPPDLRIWADIDGSGTLDFNDYVKARKNLGARLP
jgi:hypothetical protein